MNLTITIGIVISSVIGILLLILLLKHDAVVYEFVMSLASSSATVESYTASSTNSSNKLDPVMDPRLNMYDAAQQCCLLQEHLENPKRRCRDCQKKHLLTITGLLNEARSLNDKDDSMTSLNIPEMVEYIETFHNRLLSGEDQTVLGQELRGFRKKIVNAGLAKPPPYK